MPTQTASAKAPATFQPYIAPSQSPAELTVRAVIIGALFGLLFGASTVYLGLRAGLTVSASIPIAVLAISILKRLGGSTILENNIVQTIGSAGESVAAGVVFTVPALIFLPPRGPEFFNYFQITMLALAGGILGVLMMVPLRRALIVKEHGVLPYPEGTACADVLIAGERGGSLARTVFQGLGIGALWKGLSWIVQVFPTAVGYTMSRTSFFPNATLNVDVSPEYMGVGYVIGPRIAGVMFAGGVLSWLVLLPLMTILGEHMPGPFPPVPASGLRIADMSAAQLWSAYIRYIGAGAVLAAGLITLARTIPTIVSSFRECLKDFGGSRAAATVRTERDMPLIAVIGGSLALAVFLAVAPRMPTQGNIVASVLVIVFGFFFVTVSSRITGLIGSSSNPVSGMTIATLILTCSIFVALGWTGDYYSPVAICVGAVVCIAAANAGATSQDLKTGYLVGATPVYQQIGLIVGVLASALVIGATTLYLHQVMGIGSASLPAPQATLMSTIIKGLLSQNLPCVHCRHAGAVRHSLVVLCSRQLPADCHDGADLRGRAGPCLRREQDRGSRGVGSRIRHAVQLGADRRRRADRHPVRGALRQQHRAGSRRGRGAGADSVPARWDLGDHRWGAAVCGAGCRPGPFRPKENIVGR
jgi:putative OPT family oligopeptide transporter